MTILPIWRTFNEFDLFDQKEAKQILNVNKLEKEQIEEKFKHLFEINDKSKGGSFYIQSKVYRAKERLDEELKLKAPKDSKPSE